MTADATHNQSSSNDYMNLVMPNSLSPGSPVEQSPLDDQAQAVSARFQRVGNNSALSEAVNVLNGVEQNRTTELVGRIAATGEQLALAVAALRDARAWRMSQNIDAAVPGRALTEMVAYFAYGAAHGLINVTARIFAMEQRSREAFIKQTKNGFANEGFPPFGTKAGHWVSFNSKSIKDIRNATSHFPAAEDFIDVLDTLDNDKRWNDMIQRRHNDFHRWRPQSTSAGVEPTSQWHETGVGAHALFVHETNVYSPEPLETYVAEAKLGLQAVTTAMEDWLELYPAVSDEVYTFTLAAKFGTELYISY